MSMGDQENDPFFDEFGSILGGKLSPLAFELVIGVLRTETEPVPTTEIDPLTSKE